jgi:hypothetical protein
MNTRLVFPVFTVIKVVNPKPRANGVIMALWRARAHFGRMALQRAFVMHSRCFAAVLCFWACGPNSGDAASDSATTPASETFWSALTAMCGQAYGGRVVESVPPDTVMSRQALVMHVRDCSADTVRIPFHVGENRSRTWVITRTATGLRLKHDHRHQDGTPDSITMYGGDTRDAGSAGAQEFFADSLTASLIPAARTNVWTLELHPGRVFAYALRREGGDRRFRAEFDLTAAAATPPPPPWGARP